MDKYKIYTLSVLRNEIKSYNALKNERDKIIKDYQSSLQELKNEYLEYEEKLLLIKSPGKGDGLGGYVQESEEKFNYLISKKDDCERRYFEYVEKNHPLYQENLYAIDRRIKTVEYYLNQITGVDKKGYSNKDFIYDFFFNLSKKKCLESYEIVNNKTLYKKADDILSNLLKK